MTKDSPAETTAVQRRKGSPSSSRNLGVDRLAWIVLACGVVLVAMMWTSMARSVAGFRSIESEIRGASFDGATPVPGTDLPGFPTWVQIGPGSWVSEAPGSLTAVSGTNGQGTFAVTRVPSEWDGAYVMRFTVDQVSPNPTVILAASDDENYLDIRENSADAEWTFGEVLGGDRRVRSTAKSVAFTQGAQVEIEFDEPRIEVRIDDLTVASVRLTKPDTNIWVGLVSDLPGFSVTDLSMSPR